MKRRPVIFFLSAEALRAGGRWFKSNPRNQPSYPVQKGLLDLSEPFFFFNGFKWVQNPAKLSCDLRIILARNVSIRSEREVRIAVPESLLLNLAQLSVLTGSPNEPDCDGD